MSDSNKGWQWSNVRTVLGVPVEAWGNWGSMKDSDLQELLKSLTGEILPDGSMLVSSTREDYWFALRHIDPLVHALYVANLKERKQTA